MMVEAGGRAGVPASLSGPPDPHLPPPPPVAQPGGSASVASQVFKTASLPEGYDKAPDI